MKKMKRIMNRILRAAVATIATVGVAIVADGIIAPITYALSLSERTYAMVPAESYVPEWEAGTVTNVTNDSVYVQLDSGDIYSYYAIDPSVEAGDTLYLRLDNDIVIDAR